MRGNQTRELVRRLVDLEALFTRTRRQAAATVTGLAADLAAAQAATQVRSSIVTLPSLSIGNLTQSITWATPMPDASYAVVASLEATAVSLGSMRCGLLTGSATAEGCSVVINSVALISAGARLHVVGVRQL